MWGSMKKALVLSARQLSTAQEDYMGSIRQTIWYAAAFLVAALVAVQPHAAAQDPLKKERADSETAAIDQMTPHKPGTKIRLTLNTVVDSVVNRSLETRKLLLEYKGTDSMLQMFDSRLDTYLFGGGQHTHTPTVMQSQQIFNGKATDSTTFFLGGQKSFSTGTTVSASLNTTLIKIFGAGDFYYMFAPPALVPQLKKEAGLTGYSYLSGIKIEVAQELLKNAFGIADRYTETQLKNVTDIQRKVLRMKLSALLAEGLVGYWSVAIAEENLRTAQLFVKSTSDIRNLVDRKLGLGLAEREESMDWNSRVLQTKSNEEKAKKSLYDARLGLLRTLNIDAGVDDVEVDASFVTTAPDVSYDLALRDAYAKRVDWNAQKALVKNAELEYAIADNNLLPSLKLKLGAGSTDYGPTRWIDSVNTINKDYSIGLQMTYPLENTGARVRMRNARLGLKKEKLNLRTMERQIRDEVASIVKQCEVDYTIYQQAKKSREFAQNSYNQYLAKFGMGRYNSLQLKLAIDAYVVARMTELASLVTYNITLIRRDLARNVVFENYKIDVDSLLKKIEKQ